VANGGKKLSDVEPEGDFGLYMLAHDTEGNELGIYSMKK
jgi:predicted enzyme related to lactoylglutathione lyase